MKDTYPPRRARTVEQRLSGDLLLPDQLQKLRHGQRRVRPVLREALAMEAGQVRLHRRREGLGLR